MSSVNKAIIIGRMGQDPEVRFTQNNTAVANMSVATSEKYKDSNGEWVSNTQWHRVVAWGRLAEVCGQYLKKGSLAYFEGPIQTRTWENKEGVKQYTTEIKALSMQMLGGKTAENDNSSGGDLSDLSGKSSGDDKEDVPF